jgi:hypothetical protein
MGILQIATTNLQSKVDSKVVSKYAKFAGILRTATTSAIQIRFKMSQTRGSPAYSDKKQITSKCQGHVFDRSNINRRLARDILHFWKHPSDKPKQQNSRRPCFITLLIRHPLPVAGDGLRPKAAHHQENPRLQPNPGKERTEAAIDLEQCGRTICDLSVLTVLGASPHAVVTPAPNSWGRLLWLNNVTEPCPTIWCQNLLVLTL